MKSISFGKTMRIPTLEGTAEVHLTEYEVMEGQQELGVRTFLLREGEEFGHIGSLTWTNGTRDLTLSMEFGGEQMVLTSQDEYLRLERVDSMVGPESTERGRKGHREQREDPEPEPKPYPEKGIEYKEWYEVKLALGVTYAWGKQFTGKSRDHTGFRDLVLSKMIAAVNTANAYSQTFLGIRYRLHEKSRHAISVDDDDFISGAEDMEARIRRVVEWLGQSGIPRGTYAVGHVFQTGYDGLGFRGFSCRVDNRNAGVTGYGVRGGDRDLVYFSRSTFLHELGHQWGMMHTYSYCPNFMDSDRRQAVELGAGRTIMSYAQAACSSKSPVGSRFTNYHVVSVKTARRYVEACDGTVARIFIPEGRLRTEVEATWFRIPPNTPFLAIGRSLSSPGDPSRSRVLSSWEQLDVGRPYAPEDGDQGDNPLFTNIRPKTFSTRLFIPNVDPSKGMLAPTTNRDIHLQMISYDHLPEGGRISVSPGLRVQVDATLGYFLVYGEKEAKAGDPYHLLWNALNPEELPKMCVYLIEPGDRTDGIGHCVAALDNDGSGTFRLPAQTRSGRVTLRLMGQRPHRYFRGIEVDVAGGGSGIEDHLSCPNVCLPFDGEAMYNGDPYVASGASALGSVLGV